MSILSHFQSVWHIKKAHQKLIIITTVLRNVCDVHTSLKQKKWNKKSYPPNIRYHSFIYNEGNTWYISCKIHVAHTRHTYHTSRFVLQCINIKVKKNKNNNCAEMLYSISCHQVNKMLVTVCLCCYSPSKFEYGQHWPHVLCCFYSVIQLILIRTLQTQTKKFLSICQTKFRFWVRHANS